MKPSEIANHGICSASVYWIAAYGHVVELRAGGKPRQLGDSLGYWPDLFYFFQRGPRSVLPAVSQG